MVMCFVPLCRHYSERGTCKYFTFPANKELKKQWVEAIGKSVEPTRYSLVCSCHFENGDKKNMPTIFDPAVIASNLNKRKFIFRTPEKQQELHKKRQTGSVVRSLITAFSGAALEDQPVPGPSISQEDVMSPSGSSQQLAQSEQSEPTPEVLSSDSQLPSRSSSRLSSEASLSAENYFLHKENEELRAKAAQPVAFSYEQIKNKDDLVLLYTGIPSHSLFMILYEMMAPIPLNYYAGWNVVRINKCDQLIMTLMKLRLNLRHLDLSVRFCCSTRTVTNIVMTWIYALHNILFKQLMAKIPSRRKNAACLPAAFSTFSSCRIVLDCTEVTSDIPRRIDKQKQTYSSYKHRNTWKILVGVAPNGVITYCSAAYPGSSSDKKIVEHSQVVQHMEAGDLILADKGFLIREFLPPGVALNIPPFLTLGQFTETQVYETQRIARARIHVERAIERLKSFHILDKIPQYYFGHISIMVQTCTALTNFQYPLIKAVQEYFYD